MVTERFLRYVTFATTSDETSVTCPSTDGQKRLGAYLVKELREAGLSTARMDENGYVYAHIAASPDRATDPAIALIAHMDTSPAASGQDVRPVRIRYDGGAIKLANGREITPADTPELTHLAGEELIVTDGTTLLGADDKAGVAEIVETAARLCAEPTRSHPRIAICFTPDEEIGRGADRLDLGALSADYGYTVDGGALGEIEYENFNAAAVSIAFHGINIHPGSAKGIMKNACLMIRDFLSRLPAAEDPAHTSGYEGFYHVTELAGDETEAQLRLIIRDHDRDRFEARKTTVRTITDDLTAIWGEGAVDCTITDSYYNMRDKILPVMFLVDNAKAAMRAVGVEPLVQPIRGGTDGARLSYMGLPCPNLSTGGINFHSTRELIPVASLEKMVEVLLQLVTR